jgi:hypothetical protein
VHKQAEGEEQEATHVAGKDTTPGLVVEAGLEKVERVGGRSGEEVAQWRARKLTDGDVVGQFRVTLDLIQSKRGE